MIRSVLFFCAVSVASAASAMPFDVASRKTDLLSPEFAEARQACLAAEIELDDTAMSPVAALKSTPGYGSDNSIEPFVWHLMVLTGRAVAGDDAANAAVIASLDAWARVDALAATENTHDTHFALKRALLPLIMSYAVIADGLGADQDEMIRAWLDTLVRKIDYVFDGDVDRNNHRYLADSVLASWGAITGNGNLLDQGEARLRTALLEQMRSDGSLPLEARRGARAIWYHRQSLASLTTILAALQRAGRKPLEDPQLAEAWEQTLTYFTDSVRWPRLVKHYAAENYIPGPSDDFRDQDLGFLERRGHGRHYLAWMERAIAMTDDPAVRLRMRTLLDEHAIDERPLIDDFSGGAVTCFMWDPSETAEASDVQGAAIQ